MHCSYSLLYCSALLLTDPAAGTSAADTTADLTLLEHLPLPVHSFTAQHLLELLDCADNIVTCVDSYSNSGSSISVSSPVVPS